MYMHWMVICVYIYICKTIIHIYICIYVCTYIYVYVYSCHLSSLTLLQTAISGAKMCDILDPVSNFKLSMV